MPNLIKIRKQTEREVLQDCKKYLSILQLQKKILFKRMSTTGVPIKFGNVVRLRRNEDMEGVADLMVFFSLRGWPMTLHIELKSTDGDLTESQVKWREQLHMHGHKYHVVRCLDDLMKVLREYGIY